MGLEAWCATRHGLHHIGASLMCPASSHSVITVSGWRYVVSWPAAAQQVEAGSTFTTRMVKQATLLGSMGFIYKKGHYDDEAKT